MTDGLVRRARVEATVHGRVQGVGFRYFVADVAIRLDLDGWVANAPDGSVRCVAEGPHAALAELVADLERGPIGARVASVDVSWSQPAGMAGGFFIRSLGHPGD